MPRPRVADDQKAVSFPATVPPWMDEWVEQRVGVGKRWPHRAALLRDALLLMMQLEKRLEALDQQVREEFLQSLLAGLVTQGSASQPLVMQPPDVAEEFAGERELPAGRLLRVARPGPPASRAEAQGEGAPRDVEVRRAFGSKPLPPTGHEVVQAEARLQEAIKHRDWSRAESEARRLGLLDEPSHLVRKKPDGSYVMRRGNFLEYYDAEGRLVQRQGSAPR